MKTTLDIPEDLFRKAEAVILPAWLVNTGRAIRMRVPMLALAEIAGAIARRSNSTAIAEAVLDFLNQQTWLACVPIDHVLGEAAARLSARHRLRDAGFAPERVPATLQNFCGIKQASSRNAWPAGRIGVPRRQPPGG